MADLFAMAITAQPPVQGDDSSVTIHPQEQRSYQPAPTQTSTHDSEDFDLSLFNTLNPSSDELMGAIPSEFNHNPDSFHDAAATKMQQPPTPASTDGSGNNEQKQRPTRRLNNSDMIRYFTAKKNNKSHETRCHQRPPTSPIAQSRKRKLGEPAVACPAPASLEQHPHKLPRTGNHSITDMLMAKAFDDIAQLQTPGSSYGAHNNWQQSGSSQANPLVLDDDDDGDDGNGITAQQQGGPPSSYNTIAKPATLPETTAKHAASSTCNSSSAAVAFAVEETIPLPPTIGGHAHRTFAFSPACQISIRRGGRLLSIKKDQQQVLHFTNNSKNKNKNNNEKSITKNHTGDGKLPDEAGSCVHSSSSSNNSSSVGEDEDKETERRNDGDQEVSRFKVVGFGPCSRCCQSAPGGRVRLCDRGFPCGSCLAEVGGDVGVAMEKCLLPVVARPEGAINGDELLKRGARVVRPGMVVAVEQQVKAVEGFGVGEH